MMSDENKDDKGQTIFKAEVTESTDQQGGGSRKTSTGLDENVASALCYLVSFITGIVFLIIEKENKTVRFHAMQSVITFASIFVIGLVIGFVPVIGWIIGLLIAPLGFILWLFLMFKAYQGGTFKLPIIGDFAEEQVNKMNN